MMNEFNQLAILECMADNLLDCQAKLRQQSYSLITAILRELGGEIKISTGYFTAGVLMDNRWTEVESIVLVGDVNYEVFFKDKRGKLIDAEDIESFHTNILGENEEYEANEMLYFLTDFSRVLLAQEDAAKTSEVND